jgi:hypothetical protein
MLPPVCKSQGQTAQSWRYIADGGQVDVGQLCALIERCCDWPAKVWVVPAASVTATLATGRGHTRGTDPQRHRSAADSLGEQMAW